MNDMDYQAEYIVGMVESSLVNLENPNVIQHEKNMPPGRFFDEFQRLSFKTQRQVGKSAAAIQLLTKHHNSLIITARSTMRAELLHRIDRNTTGTYERHGYADKIKVFSPNLLEFFKWKMVNSRRPQPYDVIIADQPNLFSTHDTFRVMDEYTYFIKEMANLYVELY